MWEARSYVSFWSPISQAKAHCLQGKGDPNKKIQPKAAPSRRVAPSNLNSASVSVDRQTFSQTPQPRPAQPRTAASPAATPSNSECAPPAHVTATTVDQAALHAVSASQDESDRREVRSRSVVRTATPVASQPSQKSAQNSEAALPAEQRVPWPSDQAPAVKDSSAPVSVGQSAAATISHGLQPVVARSSWSLPGQVAPAGPAIEDSRGYSGQPAAKRRRTVQPEESTVSGSDAAGPDEALPTTENDGREELPRIQVIVPPPSQVYSRPIIRPPTATQPVNKQKSRLSAKAKGKQRVAENAANEVIADAVRTRSGQQRKAAQPRNLQASNKITGTQTVDEAAEEIVAAATTGKKGRKRKRRDVTPENAESIRIAPSRVLMSELTRNLRTGKKSTREAELEEMEQVAKAKRKQQRKDQRNGINQSQDESPTNNAHQETGEERLERIAREKQASRAVPNTIIVNGQIRIDESSLQIDRHAAAAAERDAEQLEAVDESELTRQVNSGTWLKRDKSGGWGEMLTDQFYEGLRMFGTDFEMISKMFPGKTRHSVKLKFNKEERDDPRRIEMALKEDRLPINMEEFQKVTNTVFSDPKELEREMEEDKKRIEEEAAAAKAALDEALKQRADEAAAEALAAENESSAKENQAGEEGEAEAGAMETTEQTAATKKRGRNPAGQASSKRKGKEKQHVKKSQPLRGKVRPARPKKPLENTTAGAAAA